MPEHTEIPVACYMLGVWATDILSTKPEIVRYRTGSLPEARLPARSTRGTTQGRPRSGGKAFSRHRQRGQDQRWRESRLD